MSHSTKITLIGNQVLKIGDKEVSIHDIEAIEIGDNYRVTKVKFKENKEG